LLHASIKGNFRRVIFSESAVKKQEIEEILSEARAMDRGEIAPARVWEVTKHPDGRVERKALNPESYRRAQAREWTAKTQAAKIRREINLTQDAFARMLGVSLGTVRKWERGVIEPSGAARTLLKIAAKYPAIVREAAMS
jgi:DNA-binding transcriptional regulator YiaG